MALSFITAYVPLHRVSYPQPSSSALMRLLEGKELIATLGNFDGVHRGHQQLITQVVAQVAACNAQPENECAYEINSFGTLSALITFYPHPQRLLQPGVAAQGRLTSLRQQQRAYTVAGIDLVVYLRFSRHLQALSAKQFIDQVLIDILHVKHLVIGEDASVGKDREGDVGTIRALMEDTGRSVEVIPFLRRGDQKIGSRTIRSKLEAGDLATAQLMLGRPFSVEGLVIKERQLGRTLGVPTANLLLNKTTLPPSGVYLTLARLVRATSAPMFWRSVTNVGVRPTFGGDHMTCETHLIDYQGDEFYGARLEVFFIKKLRDEQTFTTVEALSSQIKSDVFAAKLEDLGVSKQEVERWLNQQ